MWFRRPLDVVESLTWIERKVSLSMGHGTCMRRVRGSRHSGGATRSRGARHARRTSRGSTFQPSAPRRARRRRSRQSEAPMGRLRTPEALRGGETMPGSPPRTPISNDSREVYPESRLFPLSYQRGGLGVGTGDVGLARAARVHAFLLSMHPLTCLEHTSSSQKERPESHLRSRKISILSRAGSEPSPRRRRGGSGSTVGSVRCRSRLLPGLALATPSR